MLRLTRGLNQSVIIGEHGEIKITVQWISRRSRGSPIVELAIEADPTIPVDREEIFLRKQAEKGENCS